MTRLSWNEIRSRAAAFAREWADAAYEKGETHGFYNEFFEIFGVRRRTVARYEEHVRRLDDTHGFIDLFWPGVLLVEQKSAGRDLAAARGQAGACFDALPERDRPRYQLLCDFRTFELLDRDEREETRFALSDLPAHVEKFGFILGVQRRTFRDQDPVNVEASELVARLHDALEASGYDGRDLELFLVRIVFCLFADDTGIFEPRDVFLQFVEERTASDGSDLGPWLARLFQVLDTPEDRRQAKLDEDLARFPYVDGDLFAGPIRIPDFDAAMRGRLLDAGRFDWTAISPAIFGALFQSVMEPAERRAAGAHYTTEKNILKVIEPLFLDDLRAEFAKLKARRDSRAVPELHRFQQKLGRLRLFDPACGCGNFLIIAYRELRALEIEVLRELRPGGQFDLIADTLSVVDVDQFYGIEIGEFPARIAATALWMMDHVMNARLSLEFGLTYARIPIEKSPNVRCADALEIDWAEVLPPGECDYVFGNPPFGGSKYQSPAQRAQVRRIAALGGSGGTLDYVAAWFVRAGEYVRRAHPEASLPAPASPPPTRSRGGVVPSVPAGTSGAGTRKPPPRIGFVATNSITQGEQAAQLWPILFDRQRLEIAFAHRTFAWGSDARGVARVHVTIIGLDAAERGSPPKRLFSCEDGKGEPLESRHAAITPYLFDGGGLSDPHLVVWEEGRPINGLRQLLTGSQPIDGGLTIFDAGQRSVFTGRRTGRRAVPAPLRRRPRVPAGRRALDPRPARRLARRAGPAAARPRAHRRGPRLAADQQTQVHAETGRHAHAVAGERTADHPVSRSSGGQFRTARVRPRRLARTTGRPEQPRSCPRRRDEADVRPADLRHAHGVAAARRRPAGEPLPILRRPRLQHVPGAARLDERERGFFGAGAAGAGGARRPRRAPRLHAGRAVRPGPDAAEPPPGAPRAGPRRRPPLPPDALRVRARARRAPLRALRAPAGAAGRRGRRAEAPVPAAGAPFALTPL